MSVTNGTVAKDAKRLLERLAPAPRHICWTNGGWVTVDTPLTADRLREHLAGTAVVGSYPAADGVARFGIIDVDVHPPDGQDPTPEEVAAAEEYAMRKSAELGTAGVDHILIRGHDGGSYHLDFATTAIPADRLGRWLKAFVADAGPVQVDTFPAPGGGGNAVRLPGRHHKRSDSWSAVRSGDEWKAWPAPLQAFLELRENPADRFPDPGEPDRQEDPAGPPRTDRPGDVFNLLVPIEDVLAAYGWTLDREDGDRVRWTRPGKSESISASVRGNTVWVFTSAVKGLPKSEAGGKPYTAFALVACLEFGGNFARAAAALAKQGFCSPPSGGRSEPKVVAEVPDTPPPPTWPEPPGREAFFGLVGDITAVIEPASESDPVAVLVQTLICFGNRIGRRAHWVAESVRHYGNEFAVLMGQSSKARKGTSWGQVHHLFQLADQEPDGIRDPLSPSWSSDRILSGLSSGEGMIWAVRDPISKNGEITDEGVSDKRLLALEPEFANVLKQNDRQGNTLSTMLRQAWETGKLGSLVKNSPARSTDAHISVIGHITTEELSRYLTATESANGFGNRIMWFLVRRSKYLPEGGEPERRAMGELATRLRSAVRFAEGVGLMARDEEARELWHAIYRPLSEGGPGLAGALLGRAEAHVMRLAMLYALLDESPMIRAEHLLAATSLWDFSDRSVKFVFGESLGNPLADDLARLIRQAGTGGVTKSDIFQYLGRHAPAEKVNQALNLLVVQGVAYADKVSTGGRPSEKWFPGRKPNGGANG